MNNRFSKFLLLAFLIVGLSFPTSIFAEADIVKTSNEFGVFNGVPIENIGSIINDLNAKTGKPIVELLFSEAFRPKGVPIAPNMGGHIAVAVNGTAYSMSSVYAGKTGKLSVISPINEYLYGTKAPSGKIPFGTGIGACYARTVWGLRVFKLPKKYNVQKIANYWNDCNIRSAANSDDPYFKYDFRTRNCGTYTAHSLKAGGFQDYVGAKHLFDFPRDIFTDFLQELFANKDEVEWEIVRYEQVNNGKYWSSMYVPNFEWQRIIKSLPVLRHFFKKKIPNLKKNTSLELYVDRSKKETFVKIRTYTKQSWLNKLMKKKK